MKIKDVEQNKISYFNNLDGLRAIAAFCVISAHHSYWFEYPTTYFYNILKWLMSFGGNLGRTGVICFFVLSGFLITYLMFIELAKHGKVNVYYFYLRRVLRIWPLYFLTLFVGFVIYPLLSKTHTENASWLWYSLFIANFDNIYHGFPTVNMLGVQWSVAVEEQFYLLWPIMFLLVGKKKIFPYLLLIVIFISELFYITEGVSIIAGDYHFLSCIRYLSFGGLLAYLCYYETERMESFFAAIKKSFVIIIYIICLALMLLQNYFTESFSAYKYIYHIVPVLFSGFVITEQNFSANSFFKIGSYKILGWLGKISYGLYLTHMIAINIVLGIVPAGSDFVLLKVLFSVLLCILISHLSYMYFEKYFLSLKNKFSVIPANADK